MIKDLSLQNTIEFSRQLSEKIKLEYSPEIIIGIDNGGILPCIEIAKSLNLPYNIISIKRDIDLSDLYNNSNKITYPLIKLYQGYLFLSTKPKLKKGLNINIENKNILLVDDTIHTGKTLELAKNYLQNFNLSELKIACINTIKSNNKIDFYLFKQRIRFPWSKNSKEYDKFINYLKENNIKI